ncbi:hypothetical protein CO615_00025 [Lysobacteraceae bacterium NML75-0749]|nr:hypothetical protein CO615_00025 [Xanthomonadaceae bacterium NML75-0749]
MSFVRVSVDPGNVLARQFSSLEAKQLPFAAMQAVNRTAWEVRQAWMRQAQRVFDRPAQMTLRAVVYKKATKQKPWAEIKLRDEAFKGTPPAKYLLAEVQGGMRRHKRHEKSLQYAGILPPGMYTVPGKSAPLDAHGNIPGRVFTAILADVKASADPYQNATSNSRKRRRARQLKLGIRGGNYFAVKHPRGRLQPGVYERLDTGFGSGVRTILHFVSSVQYRPRYDVFGYAEREYNRHFPFFFERELESAVANAVARGQA